MNTDARESGGLLDRIRYNERTPLIEMLRNEKDIPVVVWGQGSMSYSIRMLLENNGIKIAAFWVDGAPVNKESEIPVYDYCELKQKYRRFNVVCGHSRYDLVDEVETREEINRVFCFVNVCYYQWKGISREFVNNHIDEYESSYELFDDELSRDCFVAFLNCKINEDYHYILPCCHDRVGYFNNPFFDTGHDEVFLDVGAYDGDTVHEFLEATDGVYKKIIAVEPDYSSNLKLRDRCKEMGLKNIEIVDFGCWDMSDVLHFSHDHEVSSVDENGVVDIEVKRIDDQFLDDNVTLVKINYLHGIVETLRGARQMLITHKPKMAIVVGFDEWGLIRIPTLIKDINPEYSFGLRYASPMPARLILFAY